MNTIATYKFYMQFWRNLSVNEDVMINDGINQRIGCVYISTLYQTKFLICDREFGPELWYRTRLVLAAFTYKLHKSVEFGPIFSGPISYYFKEDVHYS